MEIQVVGELSGLQTIAAGTGIREISRLKRVYGPGRWRKQKGIAAVRLPDGSICTAEVHWYEAHGVGRRELKIKRIIGD